MNLFDTLIQRKFNISLLERDKNPKLSFSKLKYHFDYPSICDITDNLPYKETFEKYIYGIPLPKSISEIASANIIYQQDNIEAEINWTILSIRKYNKEINAFIKYRYQYETLLIEGEYDKAEEILNRIESEICYSLWGIENRFLLIELQRGLKENTSYLNEITNKNKNTLVQNFAYFFSIKAEKDLSVTRYDATLLKFLLPLIQKNWDEDLNYYVSKLSPLLWHQFDKANAILAFDNYNSIIDRYISLISVFRMLLINEDNKDILSHISSRLFYLSKKILDLDINRLLYVLTTDRTYINSEDRKVIAIMDLYTNGKYQECQIACMDYLRVKPLTIELYPIYVKSLLQQKNELKNWAKENSFQYSIIDSLYNLYKKESNPAEAGIVLTKIAYNLSSISYVPYFLIDIVKQEVENNTDYKNLSIIHSSFLNPLLGELSIASRTYYLDTNKFIQSSSTILLRLEMLKGKISNTICSPIRQSYYQALLYKNKKNYNEAISILSELEKEDVPNYFKERILIDLFDCQQEINNLDFCVNFFVENTLKNRFLTYRFDVKLVKNKIINEKYANVEHNIQLPIFFYLINSDSYETHIAYECFMEKNVMEKPTDFIKTRHSDALSIYFLQHICTIEILKHSIYITNTKEKYNERIEVCKYLTQIDEKNKELYSKESDSLEKQLILQKGLQEVDESKIYVNTEYIKQSELKDLESIFKRFVIFGELQEEDDISIINVGSEDMFKYSLQNEKIQDPRLSKDPQYDVFKDLFFTIRDKFLFSKQGLKMYLSARIRHGVLVGELRPEFELLHLVTEKEKGQDSYKENQYWEKFIPSQFYQILNKELTKFSRQIDSIINDDLLEKYLLIKTEKENSEGWLDYVFDEKEGSLQILQLQYVLLKNQTNYQEFIEKIFDILWQRTEENLWAVRENINGEIKNKFFEAIQALEKNIQDNNIAIEEFANNLTEIRIKIENKLDKIANWFNITNTQIPDFKIDKIVDVCCESMKSNYTSKTLDLQKNIQFEDLICGRYYSHFVDLLRIFFQNILDYSDNGTVKAFLTINREYSILYVSIKNPLKENENINTIREKSQINSDGLQSQKDKKSGLAKAYNIIKYNFGDESNGFNIDVRPEEFCVSVSINLTPIMK